MNVCFRGAHGLGQVQLKEHSCSREARARARKLGLYRIKCAVRAAARVAHFWEGYCLRNHLGNHEWLLHYNQGLGFCNKKKCLRSDYKPVTKGPLGAYGRRVRKIRRRLLRRLPPSLRKEFD